jgi:hypothetical protein
MACTTCESSENKYYVGDIGTEVIVDTCSNISSATTANLKVEKPDGTLVTWVGVVYQTTKIRYVILDGDFDQAGKYLMQAYVEIGSWSGHGDTVTFTVSELFG